MNLPDIKQLKKLAAACRKAGIRHFKSADFEFTLEDLPEPKPRKQASKDMLLSAATDDGRVQTDEMSPDAMLFWSSDVGISEKNEKTE